MMILTALLIVSVAADIAFSVQSSCQNVIYCPCGSTKKNITICLETESSEKEPCKRLSRCKRCQDGLGKCLECEEGFKGPLCSISKEQEIISRQKRQYPVAIRRQGSNYGENVWRDTAVQTIDTEGNCPHLKSPKLGNIKCVTNHQYRTCVGKCLPGYYFEGHESEMEITLTCGGSNWTPLNAFPLCKSRGHCELIVQGSGSFNCTTGMTGTRCDVNCNNQYVGQFFCLSHQNWEPSLPRCMRPKEIVNSMQGCRCEYGASCDSNGNCVCPVGRTGILCEDIVAEGNMCDDPGFVQNGIRRNSDDSISNTPRIFEEGDFVRYECRSNDFSLEGASIVTCQNDGIWSRSLPKCVRRGEIPKASPKSCRDPGMVFNGIRRPPPSRRGFRPGSEIQFTCNDGYVLSSKGIIICLVTGEWSESPPSCEADEVDETPLAYCLNPGPITNGEPLYYPSINNRRRGEPERDNLDPEYPQGSRLEFLCNPGYFLEGADTIICDDYGQWTADKPTCKRNPGEAVSCRYPGSISNGRVLHIPPSISRTSSSQQSGDLKTVGSRLQYSCNRGYRLQGSPILTCGRSGSWSAKPPECKHVFVMYCSKPQRVFRARITVSAPAGQGRPSEDDDDFPEGTRLDYTCEDEYQIQGAKSIRCQTNGDWTDKPPTCYRDCGRSFMSPDRKIVDGEKTYSGEWPWVVAIAVEDNNFTQIRCGGALLDSHTVLTAAHCLSMAKTFILYFGKLYRNNQRDSPKVSFRRSKDILIHPDYNNASIDSDIGLVTFEPKLQFSPEIEPICLPTAASTARNLMTGKIGYVTGWGYTEKGVESNELMLATLPVLTNQACMESYRRQNVELQLTRNMFCAGGEGTRQAVCEGDSGSPLVFYNSTSERYNVEGLVSFGMEVQCGRPGTHAIFTNVYQFLPWIIRNTQ